LVQITADLHENKSLFTVNAVADC